MEFRKIVPKNLFTGKQWRNWHREQTYGHGERGGEGEMYGKCNTETYTTICKIDSQQEFAVCLRNSNRGSEWTRGVEWKGRWEGGSKGRWYMYTYGGEGDNRGWDGWMASLTQWMWVWVNSGSWWWTGRPSVLWFVGSQRVRHDWATELNWIDGWFRLRFDRKQQDSVKQLSFIKK